MKRAPPPVGAVVVLTWDDAYCDDDGADDDCIVQTVGWVVRVTRRSIFVAAERLPDGRHRGITRVPRAIVRGLERFT